MSIRNVRPMATKLPTAAELEAQREKDIPTDLHPMFYKLKKDQKLYQVRIFHFDFLDSLSLLIFHLKKKKQKNV